MPQLSGSVLRSAQVPLQFESPAWHDTTHLPAVQTSPATQEVPAFAPVQFPEAPQYWSLVSGLTQSPPHSTSVARQDTPQTPPEHVSPAPHALPTVAPVQAPDAPQKRLFVAGSMQPPAQSISVPGHVVPHTPALHTWPALHAVPALAPVHVPDAPQYMLLASGSTHEPPQLISLPGHDVPHAPPLHTWPALHAVPALAPVHVPDAPQYVLLVVGSTQEPPQLISLPGHDVPHTPPVHAWPASHAVPALAPVQAPDAPQYMLLVAGSTHAPPHRISEPGHAVPHTPALHDAPAAHATPAEPAPPTPHPAVAPQ
jgi:hypothetical protein